MHGTSMIHVIALVALSTLSVTANPIDSLNQKLRINFNNPRRWRRNYSNNITRFNYSSTYLSFGYQYGSSPITELPSDIQIGFPYATSSSHQNQSFQQSLRLGNNVTPRINTITMEYGRTNGMFYGVDFYFHDSSFTNAGGGFVTGVDFKIGRNFAVNDILTLRPTFSIGNHEFVMYTDDAIDNRQQDLYILGKTFPYSYWTGGKNSHIAHNDFTKVGYKENATLLKLKLELSCRVYHTVTLHASIGYCWDVNENQYAYIKGGGKHTYDFPLGTPGLNFSSTAPAQSIFSYDGICWNVGVSVAINNYQRHYR